MGLGILFCLHYLGFERYSMEDQPPVLYHHERLFEASYGLSLRSICLVKYFPVLWLESVDLCVVARRICISL